MIARRRPRPGPADARRGGVLHRLRVLAGIAVLALGGCGGGTADGDAAQEDPTAFRILAGSELKDLGPAIEAAARDAGVPVSITYSGTLDMVDRVNAGERFDAILPPNGAYPSLALTAKPLAREKLFYSRVAIGVRAAKARALGWEATPPTWAQIAAAAKAGEFRYGMTSPTSSNTGMSALFAVASAVAGKTEDLTAAEVDRGVLKDFLSGQKLTSGSSGWLAEAYVKQQDALDGLVNYEAVLLRLNQGGQLREPLVIVYPRDGVITADYPLLLLSDARRAEYATLVAALKAPAFQGGPVATAFLRPSNPDATPAAALPTAAVAELSFPNSLEVIDAVLVAYQDELRRPATSVFVLDISGSMAGDRLQSLKEALKVLSGADTTSLGARFARFQNRERAVMLAFDDSVRDPQVFDFSSRDATAYAAVRAYADGLHDDGGTAIFSALMRAQQLAQAEQHGAPDHIVSVVLLTDGENTSGASLRDFEAAVAQARVDGSVVRTFPVIFGEADPADMQRVAELTGGRVFDGRKGGLAAVFKEIRGYQ